MRQVLIGSTISTSVVQNSASNTRLPSRDHVRDARLGPSRVDWKWPAGKYRPVGGVMQGR